MSRLINTLRMSEPLEMTFTLKDADMAKLQEIFINIDITKCPYFEIQDRHGNKAIYYREDKKHTIKEGKWERIQYSFTEGYKCTCCGQKALDNYWNYCPVCGADMRGEKE